MKRYGRAAGNADSVGIWSFSGPLPTFTGCDLDAIKEPRREAGVLDLKGACVAYGLSVGRNHPFVIQPFDHLGHHGDLFLQLRQLCRLLLKRGNAVRLRELCSFWNSFSSSVARDGS